MLKLDIKKEREIHPHLLFLIADLQQQIHNLKNRCFNLEVEILTRDREDLLIQICDKCFRASCWQGSMMCDEAQDAGTIHKTVAELKAMKLVEHPEYWKTDEELAD